MEETSLVPITEARALSIEVLKDMASRLSRKTPKAARLQRVGGGGTMLTYAPWPYVAGQLNEVFGPTWSFTLVGEPQRTPLPPLPPRRPGEGPREREEVIVTVRLATPLGVQEAVGSHTYWPSNPDALYGDVLQAAQSKALRRAAARWGVALDLYFDEDEARNSSPEFLAAGRAFAATIKTLGIPQDEAFAALSRRYQTTISDMAGLARAVPNEEDPSRAIYKAITAIKALKANVVDSEP